MITGRAQDMAIKCRILVNKWKNNPWTHLLLLTSSVSRYPPDIITWKCHPAANVTPAFMQTIPFDEGGGRYVCCRWFGRWYYCFQNKVDTGHSGELLWILTFSPLLDQLTQADWRHRAGQPESAGPALERMWIFTAALQNDPCQPYFGSNST